MTTRVSEVIRGWLGWYPNADARIRITAARPDESISVSSGGDETPLIAVSWLSQYRIRLLFWALSYLAFSLFYLPLYLTAKNNYVSFFIAGIVIASMAFILSAKRLWRLYDAVRESGYVEEPARKQKVVLYIGVSVVILLICFEFLVFFGLVPGMDFLVLPAFLIGFSIIPWFAFWLIVVWESKSGCRLFLNEKGLYVLRGNQDAHR